MESPTAIFKNARRRLRELAPLADQLNALSDVFTEELGEVEDELRALSLGIDATLFKAPLDTQWPDERAGRQEQLVSYLAFGRLGNGWRLLVRTFKEWDSAEDLSPNRSLLDERPLMDAPREFRLAAAESIEMLLEQVLEVARRKLDLVAQVLSETSQWWGGLPHGLSADGFEHILAPGALESLCGAEIETTNYEGKPTRCGRCLKIARGAVSAGAALRGARGSKGR